MLISRITVEEPGRPTLSLSFAHLGQQVAAFSDYWPYVFEVCVRQLLWAGAGPRATWTVRYEPLP